MTDQTEPEDTCRPVDIDGETIRVRGAAEMSEESQAALAEVIRAAKRKMAAEPPPIRQQIRAVAFNAVAPALKRHDEWLRLTVRRSIADAVLAAIQPELARLDDYENRITWDTTCGSCARILDSSILETERATRAEAALARVRELADRWDNALAPDRAYARTLRAALDEPTPGPAATQTTEAATTTRVFAALHQSAEQDVTRVIDLYERWLAAGPPPLGTPTARWWDRRLIELHDAIRPPDSGPSVADCAADDRNWDVEKAGEQP